MRIRIVPPQVLDAHGGSAFFSFFNDARIPLLLLSLPYDVLGACLDLRTYAYPYRSPIGARCTWRQIPCSQSYSYFLLLRAARSLFRTDLCVSV